MDWKLTHALTRAYEQMIAWTDLLDRINVFPVADQDTGSNLRISLLPLRDLDTADTKITSRLVESATGNSGNIAAMFLSGLLTAESKHALYPAAQKGNTHAYQAVGDPKPGTMLTVFDALVQFLQRCPDPHSDDFFPKLMAHLERAVNATADILPEMKNAGVVDAGALGMYIFLEGFFGQITGQPFDDPQIIQKFKNKLSISHAFVPTSMDQHCIDAMICDHRPTDNMAEKLSKFGDSVVVIPDQKRLKIHVHTKDPEALQEKLASMGHLARWSANPILPREVHHAPADAPSASIHIMTDAAGSLTREYARSLGITLLDSYVITPETSFPETFMDPSSLYGLLRAGNKVTTAQASVYERHQRYQSVLDQHGKVLYICVGSAYTGNFETITAWKKKHDPDDRLIVIDSTAAAGRLAVMAIAAARHAIKEKDPEKVIRFANTAPSKCEGYLLVERLKYLAKGGRLSKTAGFLGDRLHLKPIISPQAGGAVKVGTAKNEQDQMDFLLGKLKKRITNPGALILLEYTDNLTWVRETVQKEIQACFPQAEILLQPLSVTTGVHTGPGTWGVAFFQ